MIHRPLNSSILNPSQKILTNSFLSTTSDSKPDKHRIDKSNPNLLPPPKDPKPKLSNHHPINLKSPEIQQANLNEDICFKCKNFGELYQCQNCFRSFHWKCIGSKKLEELSKMTHVINFICQSCDFHNHCTKCLSTYPLKNNFNLIDFSDHNSVLSFYKCTHCSSKIHRKCFDVPYEALQKHSSDSKESEPLPHYVCIKCLQNVGITQIIKTQRLSHNLGTEKLYYLVLLNTNSPIHKGWFEEITLSQTIKKFADNQTFIDDFAKNPIYQNPEIDKIIEIRFPKKHINTSILDVTKIIESKNRTPISERYGNPDNFKFLIKWKGRDYTCLSWEDQTIVMRNLPQLKRFFVQRQKWNCIMRKIEEHKGRKHQENSEQQISYKALEYALTGRSQIQLKYLHINREIDPMKLQIKSFEQRMQSLDAENAKQPFIQIIDVEDQKTNIKAPYEYMNKFVAYFQKCYMSEIILRPILIVTDNVAEWEEALKNQKKYKQHHLRYLIFYGGKENVNAIKRWDFFTSFNPCILKFDILLLDFNYFIYEKEYLFRKIPNYFAVLIDKNQTYASQTNKLQFLKQHYIPFKSKVHKEIYLIDNFQLNSSVQNFGSKILRQTQFTENPIKKSVCHTLDFKKFVRFNSSEPKLKLIIDQKFTQSINIFEYNSNQILNQGQRLSYLKFILSYGLNIKSIDQICTHLKQMNPSIWSYDKNNIQNMKSLIKKYTPMFISIVSKASKQVESKIDFSVLSHFLFSYKSQDILKRIIQLKKLKSSIERCKEDRQKFPITKTFEFFCNLKVIPFPSWSIYEDYTLGALILQEGFQRWDNLINSQKWRHYHEELIKQKFYQMDPKSGLFQIHQKSVPVKKKALSQHQNLEHSQINQSSTQQKQCELNGSNNQNKNSAQKKITTYADYLIDKIRNSKDNQQNQNEKLFDIRVLIKHIAERGDNIVNQMN